MEKKKFVVRIYGPMDPFHMRKSFYEKRPNGEIYLQCALGGWAIMFGLVDLLKYPVPMPFFMFVNYE